MRNWQTWSGSAVWMLVATLMMFAALQPVEVSAATVRTTPSINFRSIPTPVEHSKRLVINASVFGEPMWGRATIMRDGEVLRTLGFNRSKSAVFNYVAKPGRYTLTLKYVGPDWLVPVTRDVVVVVK